MTIYVQMGEIADVVTQSGVTGDAGFYNPSNSRSSIKVQHGSGSNDTNLYFHGSTFSSTNIWIHYIYGCSNSWGPETAIATRSMVRIMAGGTQRLRVTPTDAAGVKLEMWTGAAWTILGSYTPGSTLFFNNINTFDINATVAVDGQIRVYLNNTLIIGVDNVDTTFSGAVTAFDNVIWGCPQGALGFQIGMAFYSELYVTDWNTIGSKLVVKGPDANGAHAEWANGNFTVVDEYQGGVDYATSGTADQRVDWSMASFPALATNEVIVSVQVTSMINRDLGGPQHANFYVSRGGTDYDDTDQSLSLTQTRMSTRFENDPATSTTWTVADLNSTTFGIRSRT